MPIRPENKARYPADWPQISKRIREREGNACKWCRAPNGVVIFRFKGKPIYMLPDGETFDATTGENIGVTRGSEMPEGHFTKVVLTVAHLDHTPENVDDENLAALCQKCHNAYDAPMRRKGIVERKALPLFDRPENHPRSAPIWPQLTGREGEARGECDGRSRHHAGPQMTAILALPVYAVFIGLNGAETRYPTDLRQCIVWKGQVEAQTENRVGCELRIRGVWK